MGQQGSLAHKLTLDKVAESVHFTTYVFMRGGKDPPSPQSSERLAKGLSLTKALLPVSVNFAINDMFSFGKKRNAILITFFFSSEADKLTALTYLHIFKNLSRICVC